MDFASECVYLETAMARFSSELPDDHRTPAGLRERANHLRDLAWTIADDEMGQRLRDYADLLDAEALTIDAG